MKKYKKESAFQKDLKEELEALFPGCIVTKLNSSLIQGIPDLIIFYGKKWASLECKINKDADHQPNQDYYVELMDKMSFSRFIYPENKEEVLNELQQAFRP